MVVARDQFTLPLACSHCGTAGSVVWEENTLANMLGPQRRLISIAGEFHSEEGRTQSGDPVIVCNACDQILSD